MSLLIKFLKAYYKTGWRGSFRLTDILAKRIKSLQCISIETDSGIVYADLRNSTSRGLLAQPESHSGEDIVMRNFIKRGDTVFDIGAHLGLYTLLLSNLVGENGKVFAFEPNSELLPGLMLTVSSLNNVELFPIALSDRKGKINLFVPEDASMASLSDWTNGTAGNVHSVSCEMHRLDDLMEEGKLSVPNFIKCDVEGAELSIFKGAIKLLNRIDAPIIMFEVNSRAASAFEVTAPVYFEFLESLENPKYNFFEVTDKGFKKLESREIEFANVVAIPETKQLYEDFVKI